MHRDPVSSSNLKSVGYDHDEKVLEIEFHRGGIYQYFDVPKLVYKSLLAAKSKGTYFVENIRGAFRDKKL